MKYCILCRKKKRGLLCGVCECDTFEHKIQIVHYWGRVFDLVRYDLRTLDYPLNHNYKIDLKEIIRRTKYAYITKSYM